jgi:hypothetical protein
MATLGYVTGRKQYGRPQAMLWSNNPGRVVEELNQTTGLVEQFYIPDGVEVSQATGLGDFIILSDDNRDPISIQPQRIETKKRMINGRMRSFHIADKKNISTGWKKLPSRSFSGSPDFNAAGVANSSLTKHTSDGGAGGVEMLNWYNNNPGSFWLFLAYDNYSNFSGDNQYNNMNKYNEVIEVFFSDFQYNVVSRGTSTFDFWDIEVSLEEV